MSKQPATIGHWNPEEPGFWEKTGKKIANRNLWISIPALLLAFSVWMMWSIIIVQMERLGFRFGRETTSMVESSS